eukprot:6386276-Pyramimonas_sp.AAC.1
MQGQQQDNLHRAGRGRPLPAMPAHMMSQDTKGTCFSIDEETLAFTIQSLVINSMKTWRRRN